MIGLLLFLILLALIWPAAVKFILKAILVLFVILLLITAAHAKYLSHKQVASASPHSKYSAPSNLLNTEARDGY